MRRVRKTSSLLLTALYVLLLSHCATPSRVQSGCGCDKKTGVECCCKKLAEQPVKKCCKSQSEALSNGCENCTCGLEENPEPPTHDGHTLPGRIEPPTANNSAFYVHTINAELSPAVISGKILFDNSDVPIQRTSFIHTIYALRAPPALS